MTTRMTHPEHGATHAYDKSEIARLQGMGWSIEVPPAPAPTPAPTPAPVEEVKRGPGRPKGS